MNILAIRLARLGDVTLLLPALARLKSSFPENTLTLLTGVPCAPLARLCPFIDDVIEVDRIAMRDGGRLQAIRDMLRLVGTVRRRRFDLVIDFHGFRETNLLAWLSNAPQRIGLKRVHGHFLTFCFTAPAVTEDKTLHVAQMFDRVVDGVFPKSPGRDETLVLPADVRQWAENAVSAGPRLALFVDAPVKDRIWPPQYFAQVGDFAIENWNAQVVVLSSKEGRGLLDEILRVSRHPEKLQPFWNLTIPELAGLIASSRVFISNDTGPMHMGSALRVPTLGLFSVGLPEHFRPTRPWDRFIKANPIEGIRVQEVTALLAEMWVTPGRDSRC